MVDAVSSGSGPVPLTWSTGTDGCPQGQLPGRATFSVDEAKTALNPLHYVPVVGMIYRLVTGETVPAPLDIAGSVATAAVMGGPIGVAGTIAVDFVADLIRMGPDRSRPAVPEGMSATGSEQAMGTVTPGTKEEPGGYLTLATTIPDWLGGGAGGATTSYAIAAYTAGSQVGFG